MTHHQRKMNEKDGTLTSTSKVIIRKVRKTKRDRIIFNAIHSLWMGVAMLLIASESVAEAVCTPSNMVIWTFFFSSSVTAQFFLLPDTPNGQTWNDRSSGLKNVVDDWIAGDDLRDAVIAKYGNIEDWNMSGVTSLNALFYGKKTFNANLSEVRNFFSSLWCIYMDD